MIVSDLGQSYMLGAVALTRKGISHLEVGAGLQLVNGKAEYGREGLFLSAEINIGYRLQRLNNSSFVFRIGVGYPQLLYISTGYAF